MPREPTPLPVACTLSPADLSERRRAWAGLLSASLRSRESTPAGLRLEFDPGAEERLRELARLEAECCAFAAWHVRAEPGAVVLEVSASGEGVAAVREMFPARTA